MEFRFHCQVVQHVSGRVTVIPLDHPGLAVHASTFDDAILDLTLAFDDRISRTHPRYIASYASGAEGEGAQVTVQAQRVWHGEAHSTVGMRFWAWQRRVLGSYVEVYLPRPDARYWLDEAEQKERLPSLLLDLVKDRTDDARLSLVLGGRSSFEVITVECEPQRVSALRPSELRMHERPFRTREEQEEFDEANDPARRRQRERAEAQRKRERARRHTPTLRELGVALHRKSIKARLDPVWEREEELSRLLSHVERERAAPLVVVSPQGAGKTALLSSLAHRLKPTRWGHPRPVFALDASRLIAGCGGFGEWQAQLQRCIEEARRSGAVLLLGKLIDLLDAGKSAHSDSNVAQVLGPTLAARDVLVLAEATPEDWAAVQRRNVSFASVWSPWILPELSPEATARVLSRAAERAAEGAKLALQPGLVDAVLGLCRRFWPYGALVGNAVTFLRRLIAARVYAGAAEVGPREAIEFFSGEAGIPQVLLRDDMPLDPAEVRAYLASRVMAQPQAVDRAVQVVSTIKASLQDPKKPSAVLLFAGPTGVGKTELAKALSEFVFGSRDRLVRVDMGEYLGPDALDRLMGGASGAGFLPSVVRRQPFCVLLLDELEKAHPSVFDALLGVLGEGRLSDASGKVTDFRNTVIIMTSNLGADTLRARVGFGGGGGASDAAAVRQHYSAEAQRFFRPEFFNRIDDLIVFQPLGAEAISAIVQREVARVARRDGLLRRDVTLSVDEGALGELAREGLDPRLGARPLKRAIERRLSVPAAAWLASHRQAGPVRLDVSPEGKGEQGLRFRAESLGGGAEGSRARAEAVLDTAADLRALFSRWDRSPALQNLRSRLKLLEHSASNKNFWEDTSLAEDISREAAQIRDLVGPIAECRRAAEAAEDLAVEAWYDRKADHVEAVEAELAALKERFAPLPRKVYLAHERRTVAGTLYLSTSRVHWTWLHALATVYLEWCDKNGVGAACHHYLYNGPDERTNKLERPELWSWKQVGVDAVPYAVTVASSVAIQMSGSPEVVFMQLEDGLHRFADGTDAQVVARFIRKDPGQGGRLVALPELLSIMAVKGQEIRRYSPSKASVRDFRLDEDFKIDTDKGRFRPDLRAIHERWIERSCLSQGDLSWS